MKITKKQLRRIIKEAQWGNFTGGTAALDVPMRDSGPVPKDQLRKMADIFMNDMGMSPEEVLEKPEFVEQGITDLKQLEENKMKITKRQLRRIIREEYDQLPQAGDPAESARLKAQRDAATVPDIDTNMQVPAELFNELTEYLEDMSELKLKGSSRARELLLKLERELGIL